MKPCILPWINFGTNTFGKPRVCGYSSKTSDKWDFNSKYFKDIRKSFLNNEWPENCERCKHVEELGGTSKRMDENHMWYDEYKHLIGKFILLPLTDREIPIIGDEFVDMEFGTGCVKVTPAHDPNDFDVAKRHNLKFINIMNEDASLNSEVPKKYINMRE